MEGDLTGMKGGEYTGIDKHSDAGKIMGGGKTAEERQRQAAAEAAYDDLEYQWEQQQIATGSKIIANFASENWDEVIRIDASTQFEQRIFDGRIFALKAIAYAKKGDYENALRQLPYFKRIGRIPDDNVYSGKISEFMANITGGLLELVMETIKQSFSKATEDKEIFEHFFISFCEREIVRNWTEMDGERLMIFWKDNLESKSVKLTKNALKRIAGNDKQLYKGLKFLLITNYKREYEPRNGFVSFLVGLAVGIGAAVACDWYAASDIEGVSMSLVAAIIAALMILNAFKENEWFKHRNKVVESLKYSLVIFAGLVIVVVMDWGLSMVDDKISFPFTIASILFISLGHIFWKRRWDFAFIVMLVVAVFGWLAFFGIIPDNGSMTLKSVQEFIQSFKDYMNE
jgi:hypothetical protein